MVVVKLEVPLKLYLYGVVPPEPFTVTTAGTVPEALHCMSVAVIVPVTTAGFMIVTLLTADSHPLLSITLILYVPADKFVN